jgi:hypothetical protein
MIAVQTMPLYEKQVDVDRQDIIAQRFLNAMSSNTDLPNNFTLNKPKNTEYYLVPCPYKMVVDYLITTDYGKVVGVIECKWYWKNWFEVGYIQPISVHKIVHLQMLGNSFNCPAYFLMRNRDGLHYLTIDESTLTRNKVETGGRTDRNNPNDLEPMVHIEERYWDIYHVGQVRQDG